MTTTRTLFAAFSFALLAGSANTAFALDLPAVNDEPVTLDVTNTLAFRWRFDNRNSLPQSPGTLLDDNYGEIIDRLNLQLYWWRLNAGVRLDTLTYVAQADAEDAKALSLANYPTQPNIRYTPANNFGQNDDATKYYRDLHARFLDTYYPSKLWVGYTQPGIDVTVGDFYAQLGRGFVLSVRKIDEVAIDTTIRGGKLVLDHDFDGLRVGATLLGGQLNPLRVDEPSGRRLHGDGSPLFFGFPEIDDFYYWSAVNDPNCPPGQRCFAQAVESSRPSYLEDTVFGGRLELGTRYAQIAGNASMLLRKDDEYGFGSNDISRSHDSIRTLSQSLNVPDIAEHGDLYVEVAEQKHADGKNGAEDLSGYAVYAAGTVRGGPLSVSIEGKHYRSYYPLAANIDITDPTFSAPEFAAVGYSQPPTAEAIYVEQIGAPNVCVTGGRSRADFRFDRATSVFGWGGFYRSYSEIDAKNSTCETDDRFRSDTWDTAAGLDVKLEEGRSHGIVWVGARLTDTPQPDASGTTAFYREGYIRYDLEKHLTGSLSLQFQGFHRHRYEPIAFSRSWNEGENYAAFKWAPHFTAIFGYEYLGRQGCAAGTDTKLCHYVNGGLQYRSGSSETTMDRLFDTVALFVGQQRGAIRCVSGVCRQFPPFEGARLELVSRF